jgi:hypothetical protein
MSNRLFSYRLRQNLCFACCSNCGTDSTAVVLHPNNTPTQYRPRLLVLAIFRCRDRKWSITSRLLPPLAVVDFKHLNALIHDVDKVIVQLNHHSVLVGRNRSSLEAPIELVQIWIGEQL